MLVYLPDALRTFLTTLFAEAREIDLSRFQMDHVCFRTSSRDSFALYKAEFLKIAELLGEAEINGRPICTFSLHEPIVIEDRVVRVIELPAPKPHNTYADGFEHAEFVADDSFQNLSTLYKDFSQDTDGLKKLFNPELAIRLPSCNIKFHHLPLQAIVQIENQPGLLENLYERQFFQLFEKYQPLFSGSVPLNIHLPSSDIDIVLQAEDLKECAHELVEFFQEFKPTLNFKSLRGFESAIVRCEAFGFKFECVVQNKTVFQILAHQHLLIESRLLNMAGTKARAAIQNLKSQGLATEPAFAQYFQIKGDPYEELLKMNQWTEQQILDFVQTHLPTRPL